MQLNVLEAIDMLENKPLKATEVERVLISNKIKEKYTNLAQPLRFAKTLSDILSEVSCPVETYDLIGGRVVHRELTDEEEIIFQNYLKSPFYLRDCAILDSGHRSCCWGYLVENGLCGLKEIVQTKIDNELDENKKIFYSAMIIVYDAIRDFGLRYSKSALENGNYKLADLLEKAVTQKPSNFCEALQLLWLVTMINCSFVSENPTVTLGRMDKYLFPLYKKDIDNGVDKQIIKDYITDYYCKHNLNMGRGEHQIGTEEDSTTFNRVFNFDSPQYLLVAGTDEQGQPFVNELTELFIECIQPKFKNPVVVVRYFKNLDKLYPKLWELLVSKSLSSSSMMYYNDDNILATYNKMGIEVADAINYEHFGCNWPSLGPNSTWISGGPTSKHYGAYESEEEKSVYNKPFMRTYSPYSWPHTFMMIFENIVKSGKQVSIEDFYDGLFEKFYLFARNKIEYNVKEIEIRKRKPSSVMIFFDAFNKISIDNGQCIAACAKYFFQMHPLHNLGTLSDCFTVIDKLVFIDKKITLNELYEATNNNFEGYDKILALINSVEKYGSDSDLSNAHARRIAKRFSDITMEVTNEYLKDTGVCLLPALQSDTWHIKYGQKFTATPNGRKAYTAYSQNARPTNGCCINGITGMLNSMLSVPSDGFLSGALNLDVNPNEYKGENGKKIFGAILASYFNRGGLHAQISSVSVEDLIKAQQNPQDYKDLRVRVTGYSGIFVDICKNLQDDIIERMK